MLPGDSTTVEAAPPFKRSWPDFFEAAGLCRESYGRFRTIVFHYYLRHRREFSWRERITPYRVVVSELMLQQTQTIRVAQKFDPFVEAFPDFQTLSEAPFGEVLRLWKGLGYNRRAKYLHELSTNVVKIHDSIVPDDPTLLVELPGIGPATAASIIVFAYNRPLPFIETNIRTVFIHFFFRGNDAVHDRDIMPLVEKTMDSDHPREWYYALMDYGVMLKKTVGNLNRRSKHYSRQSSFAGSDRQVRGKILQLLLDHHSLPERGIADILGESPGRVARIVSALGDEGIILLKGSMLTLD